MSIGKGIIVAFALVWCALGQSTRPEAVGKSGAAGITVNGVGLRIEGEFTKVAGVAQVVNLSGIMQDYDVLHRYMVIGEQQFGYDIEVQPIAGTKKVRLLLSPLGVDLEAYNQPRIAGTKPATQPSFPALQELEAGDKVTFTLAENAGTGQKVTETIQIVSIGSPAPIEVRDLQLEDLRVLGLRKPTLLEDGKVVGANGTTTGSGAILALEVPGRGWIYLAVKQYEGYAFQKAGTVQGSRATFAAGGHTYEIRSRDGILPRGAPARNLYVMLDSREPASKGSFYGQNTVASAVGGSFEFRGGSAKQILPTR
jgi:hypothetical protein